MNDAIGADGGIRYNVLLARWDAQRSRVSVTGDMMHGSMLFLDKRVRDVMYRLLCDRGEKVTRRRTGPCQIHPQYIEDFKGPAYDDNGFGNTVYKTMFGNLYSLEEKR